MATHAQDERDAADDRKKLKVVEDNHRTVINESTRALKTVVSTTTMEPDEDL